MVAHMSDEVSKDARDSMTEQNRVLREEVLSLTESVSRSPHLTAKYWRQRQALRLRVLTLTAEVARLEREKAELLRNADAIEKDGASRFWRVK